MKNHALLGALGAAFLAVATGPGLAADPAVVKIGSFTPPKAGYLNKVLIPWLRKMERDSAGTLKFQEYWGGALIRSPRKQWEGLNNGIQDATQVIPAYTSKLFPDFTFFSLPFLFRGVGSEEATVVGWKMYERGLLGGLENVKVLAVYSNDNGGLHFNRPIKSLNEMKGLKVRVPGPKQAAVLKEFGIVPVGMGTPQVAESLNRGVIQGTLTGWSALGMFRITPLIKTHVDLPMGTRSFFIAIHNRAYNRLPAKAKAAIDKNKGLGISLELGRYYERDGRDLRANTHGRGVVRLSDDEWKKLAARFKPFHDQWIKETKDGAKKYEAIQEILAKHRGSS